MKKLIFTILIILTFLATAKAVSADYGCAPYGGDCPASSQIVVDKMIRDPRAKGEVYVDNLLLSDYTFSPGEDIVFKITVKNTGNKTVDNVKAYDYVPNVASYVLLSGDPRENIRDITKDMGSLSSDETKTWFIRMRVKSSEELSQGTTCGDPDAINKVKVTASDMPDAHDASSFCVQNSVLGITTQPESGSEMLIIAAGLTALAGVGFAGQRVFARS